MSDHNVTILDQGQASPAARDDNRSAALLLRFFEDRPRACFPSTRTCPNPPLTLNKNVRKLSYLLSLIAALAISFVLVGCGKSSDSGAAPATPAAATIKIGLAGAQTGSDGEIGL